MASTLLGTVEVPGKPIPKARPRMVRDKEGNPHTYTPPRTKAYEELIGWSYKGQKRYEGPVRIVVTIHEGNGHHADVDNYVKSLDGLNGVAWLDDKQVVRIEAEVFRGSPNPSLYVEVHAYSQEASQSPVQPDSRDSVPSVAE